jgi:DNA repair exonuclease SbcCD ATPase subunit
MKTVKTFSNKIKRMSNPFIKVTWEDVPENFTPEKIKRVKSYFQEKYNSKNIQVITKTLTNVNNTRLESLEVTDNILDHQYQKKLMRDFVTDNNIDIKWELINRLDDKVNVEIDKLNENKVRYNKWYIKKVEFSNFLSFGDNNVIDFTGLDGITVIESTPKNFGGKSTSTVDLLMFLFFNTTTKTKTNAEIFNRFTDKDEVSVRGEITIDGDDYVIERKTLRKKSKVGEYTVTNKLEFYKKKEDGTVENLSGEQRRETEAFIASAIGTEEDFLSTILTTGYNLEELIESKPTARGQILTKFMGLESLKLKEERAKEIYNDWSKKLISNTYNIVQLQNDNTSFTESITDSESKIVELTNDLGEFEKGLKKLEKERDDSLTSKNNDVDKDLVNTNPVLLEREINDLIKLKKTSQSNADDVNVTEPSQFYNEDLHKELRGQMAELQGVDVACKYEKGDKEKLIKKFEEGTVCPTCNRALDEVDHTDEIEKIKKEIEDITKDMELNQIEFDKLKEQAEGFETLKTEFETYERNKLRKARYELEVEQKQLEIDTKQSKLDNYELNKKKLEENQRIDALLIRLRTQIETANADIRVTNTSIEKHKNNITNMNEKIGINNDLITKIKSEEELLAVFKIYLTIYGKNGISKVIMKNMIPLINQELYRLLVDSCHFILELNVNDKNEVEFIMIDTETRVVKPLNSGSGYERTISSLALRSVLTKISSLPKPNIVVMDEVFGKIADENLEMVGEFFKKIKDYFEHIFVISHNSLIRNWSDNLIMIKKEENVSSIDFITTKIS